ncbi:MAG: AAA_31 domain-containing protein [Arenicellales bacterium IbO2]|nr:MAG: AAA_31 domain-containing protein [Arenicellales bacterium IbO2]
MICFQSMSKMPVTVSVINLKGGVGKTTVTALLAYHAAHEWGLDVLVVDMDPQANLSQALMTENDYQLLMDGEGNSIVELFDGYAPPSPQDPSPRPLDKSIIKNIWTGSARGNLDVIPSRFDFSDNLVRASRHLDEKVLAKYIAGYMQHKDLILIDCAPTESVLTRASYHASRYVLIPVKTEFFSTIGFPLLKKSLDDFRGNNHGHAIDVCGIVVHTTKTSGSARSKDGRDSLEDIVEKADDYGWDIFENRMEHSDGYPKMARDPGGPYMGNARREWPKIADEILAKIGLAKKP